MRTRPRRLSQDEARIQLLLRRNAALRRERDQLRAELETVTKLLPATTAQPGSVFLYPPSTTQTGGTK